MKVSLQPFSHRVQGKADAPEMCKCGLYALFIEPGTFNLACRVVSVNAYFLTKGFSHIWPFPDEKFLTSVFHITVSRQKIKPYLPVVGNACLWSLVM